MPASARVVDRVALALKPGGHFFAELRNKEQIISHLPPEWRHEFPDGSIVHEKMTFDPKTRVLSAVEIVHRDGMVVQQAGHRRRLYSLEEFVAMLESASLRRESIWGDYEGAACSAEKMSMIVWSRKSAS